MGSRTAPLKERNASSKTKNGEDFSPPFKTGR
jgi:hypothetical protein